MAAEKPSSQKPPFGRYFVLDSADERKTIETRKRSSPHPKDLAAGPFEAELSSFRLHLAAEGKAPRTLDTYTGAVLWFAAAHLLTKTDKTSWEQVDQQDVERWVVRLLEQYSVSYASNQVRAIRRFLRWLAFEEDRPDPVRELKAPTTVPALVPVFTSEELSALRRACQGRSFEARRDAAVIEVFLATGIRRAEMATIRYDPGDPARSDLNLAGREIKIHGKGGKDRIVKIGYQAARAVDRYLRVRAKHPQAGRPELWLGAGGKDPLNPGGIYQLVTRAGKKAGIHLYPHRFRHHFSHTWLDRGGEGRDLMDLNGWSTPQMLEWYGGSARAARARRSYDRIMDGIT